MGSRGSIKVAEATGNLKWCDGVLAELRGRFQLCASISADLFVQRQEMSPTDKLSVSGFLQPDSAPLQEPRMIETTRHNA
jgi:hypothetical protein